MLDFVQSKEQLKEKLFRVIIDNNIKEYEPVPGINRVEIPIKKIDFLNWLDQQSVKTKIYWTERQDKLKSAGIGIAHQIYGRSFINYDKLFEEIHESLRISDKKVRYFGGLSFDPSHSPDQDWLPFAFYRFIVPQFEVLAENNEIRLACNFVMPKDGDREALYRKLVRKIDHIQYKNNDVDSDLPCIKSRHDMPDWKQWQNMVNCALDMFQKNELQKIVLAIKSNLTFDSDLEPIQLLQQLLKKNSHAFHFCFQLDDHFAFLGMTPELLYSRENQSIYSDAIAGTRPRGKDPIHDRKYAMELLNSEKDLREHRWVSDMVKKSLRPLCHSVKVLDRESLLKLYHVQHLHTRFQGKLKPDISDGDILARIHPTPAVGGMPGKESVEKIAELEPFHRGWYAGPVGWVRHDAAEFAVAIRSALVSGQILSLYAGSGIVEGSKPEKEWDENENKIMNFTNLFHCS